MDQKKVEALIEKIVVQGGADLEARMEIFIIAGDEKERIVAVQCDLAMFPGVLKGMTDKMDELAKIGEAVKG